MKKLIHTALITLTLTAGTVHASQPAEADTLSQLNLSYACKAMLERGSTMFCGEHTDAVALYAKAAISELDYISSSSYACDTMIERGSEMFCQKERAVTFSHADNR